ncbi:uncharacterized protein LOC133654118 isoform X2 [Entelurus aequoreus]|uniref:uncharacterized protein LOC133654118 isoform X2 n=1 Tax=Entelurus aequoreus TaxID=161455 RepID=UPI002B1E1B2B|nr:uncharacterized protein LOC133654118 isoform X2 [Entelurus aequoreus]
MDPGLTDLLSDAFSVTSFPDGDFETLKLDESDGGETKEAGQEAIYDTRNVCVEDTAHTHEDVNVQTHEDSFHGTPEDIHRNLEEEYDDSAEEEKGMADFLSVHDVTCSPENREEFDKVQGLILDNRQDEDVSEDFVTIPKSDEGNEKKEEKTQVDSFHTKVEVKENVEELIADVHKMKDFSGEEHQEAGESYADYPSDFSSCEYVEHEAERCFQGSTDDIASKIPERAEDAEMLDLNVPPHLENEVTMLAQCEEEQERIKAFFRFYNDSDREHEREGRETKVQFCTKPVSGVCQYDSESLSSSEEEQGLKMVEEPEEWMERPKSLQIKRDSPSGALKHETNINNTQLCKSRHEVMLTLILKYSFILPLVYFDFVFPQYPRLLKLMLMTSLVTLIGLLMFWLAVHQMDWLALCVFF